MTGARSGAFWAKGFLGQIWRYLLVGMVIYGADYLTFAGLTLLAPGQYLWANIAAKLVGAATGFILHKYYTFKGQQAHAAPVQALRYVLLLVFNMGLATLLLYITVHRLGLTPFVAKILADAVVIGCSFLVSRYFIFSHHKGD